ncbi:MAG: SH3 domain-containing protein [Eubacteriales bacterium]|nr:SH3 domain-containing protein [Eubacteriales bacterium]
MKRVFLVILMAILFAFASGGLAEEQTVDAAALEALGAAHVGYAVVSPTQWGDTAAAALCKDGESILCVAQKQNGAWRVTVDNKNALGKVDRLSSITLDTDTTLFWRYLWNDHSCIYTAICKDGLWRVINWMLFIPTDDGIREERMSFLDVGGVPTMMHTVYDEDENGNVLSCVNSIPYPIGELADLSSLADFDVTRFPDYAYPLTDMSNESIKAAAAAYLFPEDIYLGGSLTENSMQFLLGKPNGALVLAGVTFTESNGWKVVESTPLPEGTVYGYQNFDTSLYFPNGLLADVSLFADGKWGVSLVVGNNNETSSIVLGENWLADQLLAASTCYYGDHPWSDITCMDWNALPTSLESAVQRIDQSAWAVVNNPNPTDRLHLRTAPQKDASSLGKYYNGTAVRVLDENGEWLHVDVYGVEGWMMKQYLARGEAMKAVIPRVPTPNAATHLINLYETSNSEYPFYKLTSDGDWLDMRICGVVGGDWFHVWFMDSGRSGYVRQSALTLE